MNNTFFFVLFPQASGVKYEFSYIKTLVALNYVLVRSLSWDTESDNQISHIVIHVKVQNGF